MTLPPYANDDGDDRSLFVPTVPVPAGMRGTPRPHQESAYIRVRQSLARKKRRPLVQMPTGAGKTFLAAWIIWNMRIRNPGARVLFVVDAISLIDQTVKAFYNMGLHDIGVIQSDHPMTDYSKSLQIASVQTLERRGMPRDISLVIVDEAHGQYNWLTCIMASGEWMDVPFIGLSATPWSKGLGWIYDDLIIPVTMRELISDGFLSEFRVYAAAHPDLTGVKTERGDFVEGQLAEVMSAGNLIADIPKTYRLRAHGRPAVCFCVDRPHAKKVQMSFIAAGIPAGYIDKDTDRLERARIRDQLDRGEILVVCNVGCLTKGVDWALGCIILARPTKSEMLYVQMVGRGLRVNEGIDDCVILDHADNTLRLGFVTDIHHDELCRALKGDRKKQERETPVPKECAKCTYLKPPKVHECPQCGFKPERQSAVEAVDGDLVEITKAKKTFTMAEKQDWLDQLNAIARERQYSRGWVSNTYKKKFGVWPRGLVENGHRQPTVEVRNFVKYLAIAFAKGRKAA